MQQVSDFLSQLLEPDRLSSVVDIGANPIDGDPPYKKMLDSGLCQVTGFEPQQDALQALLVRKGPLETYLHYAIGDGNKHTLFRCLASGMTSLYKPDQHQLAVFNDFEKLGEVTSTQAIATRRLDDISEIIHLDMLKIDIQGGELAVFESGRNKLSEAVAIQTEISFIPLYEEQPLFWEIDRELRQQGFIPHAFDAVKRWPIAPYSHPENNRQALNQLLEADVVYIRDFINSETMTDEQVKHLALLAHHCYGSHDLVTRCLSILIRRGLIPETATQRYQSYIFPGYNFSTEEIQVNYSISFDL